MAFEPLGYIFTMLDLPLSRNVVAHLCLHMKMQEKHAFFICTCQLWSKAFAILYLC